MKIKLYALIILWLYAMGAKSQECPGVVIQYTTTESRCVATGTINVSVTGGSGSYNYRVTGPVHTPVTSSSLITGLAPGYYTIIVQDLVNNCSRTSDSVFIPGSYADPRFQLTKTNTTCAGNDGSISVLNREFGRAPFVYTIIAPSPSMVGTANNTGHFTGLVPGEYAVELHDSCGGIQVRRITVENYTWWIDSTSVTKIGCDTAEAFIRIRDNRGNDNTVGNNFGGFIYGIVRSPGDTLYNSARNFRFFVGNRRSISVVVKDNCGNIKSVQWNLPDAMKPLIGPASFSDFSCTGFNVSLPLQQNLTSPDFCLYDSVLRGCNGSGSFTNLPYGQYCIEARDNCYDTTIVVCFNVPKPVPAVGTTVNISDRNCNTFTATVTGQSNLVNPGYCLLSSTGDTLACNTSGIFTNITYGSYCISIRNGCGDTTITRCFVASRSAGTLTSHTISATSCTGFNVTVVGSNLNNPLYCLYDSTGQVVACDSSGTFQGLPYGSYCVRAISCGDTTAPRCFSGTRPAPSVGTVQISNNTCNGFTATVTGQANLSAPQYCLYNNADSLLYCNTSGVFAGLAYGSYCIKIKDSCTDTTIIRCFSATQNKPAINGTVQETNRGCAGFTATVTGTNLTNPQYCLLDTLGNMVGCNTTGVFDNVPWGRWCFRVIDSCADTTIVICQTFSRPGGITLSTSKSCVIGSANVNIHFTGGFWPFSIKIYRPDGTLVRDTITNTNPFTIVLPGLSSGQYKVVGANNCGDKDSATITPDASVISRSVVASGKCPSATWQNGAGDLTIQCTSNLYTTTPVIIRKNGNSFNQVFSSVTGNQYTFIDLEPATYVVEYNMQTCNSSVYDTVVIAPYAYPTQGQSAIYQCDNSTLSLGANVQGGLGPYTYQIIGSTPSSPSITTGVQSSPLFSINTGTIYSLVRLRAVDACGNATLDDVSVLPLQNFTVAASQLCFYQGVSLTVDSIPNATYTWYRKTTPTDSVLLGSGAGFNIPFFRPEEVGQYVCHINVHGGCANRTAAFTLDGECGILVLPGAIHLKGKRTGNVSQLSWSVTNEQDIVSYTVERKAEGESAYTPVATLLYSTANNGQYRYNDYSFTGLQCQYRISIQTKQGSKVYSNVILVKAEWTTRVYPNPVKNRITLAWQTSVPADYTVQLFDISGRILYNHTLKGGTQNPVSIMVDPSWKPGIYQLRIIQEKTKTTETHTLVLQ